MLVPSIPAKRHGESADCPCLFSFIFDNSAFILAIAISADGKVTAICVKPGQAVLEEDALVVVE